MYSLQSLAREIEKSFIGYDSLFNRVSHDLEHRQSTNFPPYNIRKVEENRFIIEMAVAGYGKNDIEITLDGDRLVIKGNVSGENGSNDYLFRGLATRAFTRNFTLNDQVIVNNATLLNGILKVFLERVIPEHKKPRKIQIEDEASTVSEYAGKNPQLLTESDRQLAEGKLM